MRKLYLHAAALFAAFFFTAPSMTARADTIWEPFGDFYEEHCQECEPVSENFLTNGRLGYITVYESPLSSKEAAKIKNGKIVYIGCTFTDKKGNIWGAVDLWGYEPEEGEALLEEAGSGWALMEDFAEIYNESDFCKEHGSEFQEYGGELDSYEIQDTVQLWTYPGSEMLQDTLSAYFNEEEAPSYEYLYTDADGLRWTYIPYYYGAKGWVCVDDPENAVLTTSYGPGVKEQELYSAAALDGEQQIILKNPADANTKIAAAAVAAVVAVTAVLIAVIFGKKKGKR